jgi:RNA polymerase sigma-70 factor (subfamily 1)
MDRASDTALIRRARDGSADALDALYARCAAKLLALIRLRMGPDLRARLESRDILQGTLLRSFQHFHQFENSDAGSLMAWLARIAENEIRDEVDRLHRQRRDARLEVPLQEGAQALASAVRSALSQAVLNERAAELERALEQLEPSHRDVIVLRYFEELNFREIGIRLARSEDACRMLLARAMAALTLKMTADR